MSKRSDKIVTLSKFCNLETGEFHKDAFTDMKLLYEKGRQYRRFSQMVRDCDKCEGLNIKRLTEAVPGWGNLNADVMIVGQSLHDLGVYSGVPFILGSGLMVDAALRLSNVQRHDCFWTNAVLCHPERNRASEEEEKENCLPYLFEQIAIVQPRVVVALGKDAKQGVEKYREECGDESRKYLAYAHPASLIYGSPESRPNYIVKMSLDLDKALEVKQ